jgi:class 3 adenylate cyclase
MGSADGTSDENRPGRASLLVDGVDLSDALRRLREVANEVARGEYSADIMGLTVEPYHKLVRELAEAMGMLMVKVEAREFELKLKNEGLEKTVAERTRELADLNRDLERRVEEQTERILRYRGMEGYLPPQLVELVLDRGDDFEITNERLKLTVFFSDIQGFTKLSDSIEPEELTSLLNAYLTEMSEIALDHGGTIDKFIGDGMMVFFGAPRLDDESERGPSAIDRANAVACVKMAIAMRERMAELRDEWSMKGVEYPLDIRIGVNSGYCTVGNFGSPKKLDYTAIGREVNLASRIEGLAPMREILVSHATWGLVREEIECEFHDEVSDIKGFQRPVRVYRVLEARAPDAIAVSREAARLKSDLKLALKMEGLADDERDRLRRRLEQLLSKLR